MMSGGTPIAGVPLSFRNNPVGIARQHKLTAGFPQEKEMGLFGNAFDNLGGIADGANSLGASLSRNQRNAELKKMRKTLERIEQNQEAEMSLKTVEQPKQRKTVRGETQNIYKIKASQKQPVEFKMMRRIEWLIAGIIGIGFVVWLLIKISS